MNPIAESGTCYSCGYDLVRVDGRTYHPHNALPKGFDCPALIPLDFGLKSLNVPADVFLSKDEDRKLRESLKRMEREA